MRERVKSGEYDGEEARKVLTEYCGVSKAQAHTYTTNWIYGGSDEEKTENEYAAYYTREGAKNFVSDKEVDADWQFVEKAIKNGDTAEMRKQIAVVMQVYNKDDKQVNTQVMKFIKKYDPMVTDAVAAYEGGNVLGVQATAQVLADKYDIDVWNAMSAIRTSATYVDEEGNIKNYDSNKTSAIPGTNFIRKDLVVAIENGDNASVQQIRSEIAAGLASRSKKETDKGKLDEAYSEIRGTLTSYYKPRYLAGDEATRAEIYNKLKSSYCYNQEHPLDGEIQKWLENKG